MSNNEVSVGKLDPLIWLVVVAIVFGVVYANMQFVAESVLIRAVGGLVLAAVAIGIALQTVKGRAAWDLAREARVEVRKVANKAGNNTNHNDRCCGCYRCRFAFMGAGLRS